MSRTSGKSTETSAAAAVAAAAEGVAMDPSSERERIGNTVIRRSTAMLGPGGWTLVAAFVVMVVAFGVAQPHTFLNWGTAKDILNQAAVPVILVSGLVFVLAVGEFDLAFTSILGMSSGLVIVLISEDSIPAGPAIAVVVAVAALAGLVVGLLVTLGRASSFIVTLAIGSALSGLELALTNDTTIYNNIPASYGALTTTSVFGLDTQVWFAAGVGLVCALVLHGSRFGRHVSAIGANPVAAFLAGVRVRRARVVCFIVVGVCASFAAVVFTSASVSYTPGASAGFLLSSYAAAFLGAAAGRRGGRFTVPGAIFGVIWLLTLETGLTYVNAAPWTTNVVQGVALATAVMIAARGKRDNI